MQRDAMSMLRSACFAMHLCVVNKIFLGEMQCPEEGTQSGIKSSDFPLLVVFYESQITRPARSSLRTRPWVTVVP